MKKPRKTSQQVDAAIKRCFAKLAQKHYEIAVESVGSLSDKTQLMAGGTVESTVRMGVVEDYLERAGAEAVRYHFKG